MSEKFGLIGKTLKHSYSKPIHNLLGDYSYELFEIAPEMVGDFVENCALKGFNITIPYKKDIMPFLDEIDERALKIGAVNTVVYRGGKTRLLRSYFRPEQRLYKNGSDGWRRRVGRTSRSP